MAHNRKSYVKINRVYRLSILMMKIRLEEIWWMQQNNLDYTLTLILDRLDLRRHRTWANKNTNRVTKLHQK